MLCIMDTSWKFESYTVSTCVGNTAEVPVKYLAVGHYWWHAQYVQLSTSLFKCCQLSASLLNHLTCMLDIL